MKAYELYSAASPALINRMYDWFRDNDRNVYKSALSSLAQSRKMRLAFLQKKPVAEQYAWMTKVLQSKASGVIGEHLLQAWFMAGNQEMLAAFCDAMEIPHNGKGSVEGDLPETMDAAKLGAAVDKLLETYDAPLVALYLYVFNLQTTGGWPELTAKLESDERLKLA